MYPDARLFCRAWVLSLEFYLVISLGLYGNRFCLYVTVTANLLGTFYYIEGTIQLRLVSGHHHSNLH